MVTLRVTLCVMGGGVVSDAEGLGLIWEMNEPWPSSTKLLAFSKKPNRPWVEGGPSPEVPLQAAIPLGSSVSARPL